ncbi:MAG: hypothetical protein ACPHSD_19635 [Candidatus Latescibacterota bacterium]
MAPVIFFLSFLKNVLTDLWGMIIILSDVSDNANTKQTEDRMEIIKIKKQADLKSAYEITAYRADIDQFYFYNLHRYEVNGWALSDEDGDCLQTFKTKKNAIDWILA